MISLLSNCVERPHSKLVLSVLTWFTCVADMICVILSLTQHHSFIPSQLFLPVLSLLSWRDTVCKHCLQHSSGDVHLPSLWMIVQPMAMWSISATPLIPCFCWPLSACWSPAASVGSAVLPPAGWWAVSFLRLRCRPSCWWSAPLC